MAPGALDQHRVERAHDARHAPDTDADQRRAQPHDEQGEERGDRGALHEVEGRATAAETL
jgi:hypothetical protein